MRSIKGWGVVGLWILAVGVAWCSIHKPILGEFSLWPWWAEQLLENARPGVGADPHLFGVWNPPLLIHMMGGVMLIWGKSVVALKSIGIGCLLASGVLLFLLSKAWNQDDRVALLACAIYLTSPLAIQGALVWSVETTILVPLVLLLLLYDLTHLENRASFAGVCWRGALLAMVAWAKFTAFPVVCFGILLVPLWDKLTPSPLVGEGRGEGDYPFKWACATIAAGSLLFLVSWGLYCWVYDRYLWGPFEWFGYAILYGQPQGWMSRIGYLIRSATILSAWVSLPFLILPWGFLVKEIRDRRPVPKLIAAVGLVFFMTEFFLVGSNTVGLPRYQFPFLPIASFMIALGFFHRLPSPTGGEGEGEGEGEMRGGIVTLTCLTGIVAALHFWLVGDLVDDIFCRMVNLYIEHRPMTNAMIQHGLKASGILAMWAGFFWLVRRWSPFSEWSRVLGLSGLVVILGCNLSLNMIQARAPYITNICYGVRGTEELIRRVKSTGWSLDDMAVTDDLKKVFDPSSPFSWESGLVWMNPKECLKIIQRSKAVIVTRGPHTFLLWRSTFQHPEVEQALKNGFRREEIGSHVVWWRV